MRIVLRRKVMAIVTSVVSITAIPVGIVATSAPALASSNICTAFGHHLCIGASTLSNGAPVQATSNGRPVDLVDQHFKFKGREVYRLHFTAAPRTLCIGATNTASENVPIRSALRDCSRGNRANVNWVEVPQSGDSVKLLSISWGAYLTSLNSRNSQLVLTNCGNCGGAYLKWVFF